MEPRQNAHRRTRSYHMNEAIIDRIEWGKIYVSNHLQPFKDVKIWHTTGEQYGVVNWDWNLTGTHHNPGIQKADLEEFIDQVDIVILSRGMNRVLQTPTETIDYIVRKGKGLFWLETREAVDKYNELVRFGLNVGALIHSTC